MTGDRLYLPRGFFFTKEAWAESAHGRNPSTSGAQIDECVHDRNYEGLAVIIHSVYIRNAHATYVDRDIHTNG